MIEYNYWMLVEICVVGRVVALVQTKLTEDVAKFT